MESTRAARLEKPHVVIVGGGFGGLSAAKALARARVRVTLLDRTNHHVFQPLLYQVASAGLSPADIAQPIRSILAAQANVEVLLAEVQSIDLAAKTVSLDDGPLSYDFLVVASGAETSYFAHGEWARVAPGMKTLEDALDLRQRILLSFEEAERTPDADRRKQLLGFVVVGAGPTGVELAGAIAELRRHVLASDFRSFNPRDASVHLVEAGPRLLPAFVESLGASARHQLEELGVEVRVGAKVIGIDATSVDLGDVRLPCSVVVWAAGVRAAPLTGTLGAKLDASGRVEVENDCSIPGHPEAFVIGDAMRMLGRDGAPLPGVSQTAMQQARFVAKIITREIGGSRAERPRFSYYDKGSMATIGRSRAIAQIGRIHLSGFVAWCAWLLVHVWFLIGFRNRVVVMLTWFWSYLTYKRGSRLITGVNALHMRSAPVSARRSAPEGVSDRSSPTTRSAPRAPPT